MPHTEHDQQLVEVATQIGKRQQARDLRNLLFFAIITLAIVLLLALLFWLKLSSVLDEIKEQNEDLDTAFADARLSAAVQSEQLERILARIEGDLIPREDIIELQAEVRILQRNVDQLTVLVRRLARAVNQLARGVRSPTGPEQPSSPGGGDGGNNNPPPTVNPPPPPPPPAPTGPGKSCNKPPSSKGNDKHCG